MATGAQTAAVSVARRLGEDRDEGGEGADGGEEGGRDEGRVAARGERDQGDRGDEDGDAAEQELEPAGALAGVRGR